MPEVTRLLEESIKRVLLAVNPEKLMVPDEVKPVSPEATPAAEISQVLESTTTAPEPPLIETVPVDVPVLMLVAL